MAIITLQNGSGKWWKVREKSVKVTEFELDIEWQPCYRKKSIFNGMQCSFSHISCHLYGRFTFERIHNTKEPIYFYERGAKHSAKERMFK